MEQGQTGEHGIAEGVHGEEFRMIEVSIKYPLDSSEVNCSGAYCSVSAGELSLPEALREVLLLLRHHVDLPQLVKELVTDLRVWDEANEKLWSVVISEPCHRVTERIPK